MTTIRRYIRKQFKQSILHGVTLVDFDAAWCEPYRTQKLIIDTLKRDYQGKAIVKQINIDEHQDVALALGIQSIPTIILFKEGKEMKRFIGLQTAETLNRAISRLIDRSHPAQ